MSENQLNKAAQEQEAPEQDINILKKDRIDKLTALRESGTDPFQVTKYDVTGHAADYKKQYEADEAKVTEEAGGDEEKLAEGLAALNEKIVRIAGRIMSWRDMGRLTLLTFAMFLTESRFTCVQMTSAQTFSRNSRKSGISAISSE